jgi:hypothetical protein
MRRATKPDVMISELQFGKPKPSTIPRLFKKRKPDLLTFCSENQVGNYSVIKGITGGFARLVFHHKV